MDLSSIASCSLCWPQIHYVARETLDFLIILPTSIKCYNYGHTPPCLPPALIIHSLLYPKWSLEAALSHSLLATLWVQMLIFSPLPFNSLPSSSPPLQQWSQVCFPVIRMNSRIISHSNWWCNLFPLWVSQTLLSLFLLFLITFLRLCKLFIILYLLAQGWVPSNLPFLNVLGNLVLCWFWLSSTC